MKTIINMSVVCLALAGPAFAQAGANVGVGVGVGVGIGEIAGDPSVFVVAQNADADRAQAAQDRAQAIQERAQAAAQAAAERAAARAAERGNFKFTLPVVDPDALYEQARQAIENSQFQAAIEDFNRLAGDKGKEKADAALYWKAYSQAKLDLDKEALDTIKELSKEFAKSSWLKDAKALEIEIQAANGQPVSAELQNDEELKLLALRGVMQSDPDKGVPIIEKMLAGGASPRVRDRALFVLSQSRSPRARDVILNTARNNANPDLQRTAIRYIGLMGGTDTRDALAGIYRSATDTSVKRAIIQSYFTSGNLEQTIDIAKSEKDPDLQRMAIRNLGLMNRGGSTTTAADALVSIYKSDAPIDTRRQVINALFIQHNAKALVELARAEKDPALKKDIVSRLSTMKAPEATDYMLELLK